LPKAAIRTKTLLGFCVRWGVLKLRPEGRTGRAEDLLPPVDGFFPEASDGLTVFAAASPDYLEQFGERFVRSVLATSPSVRLHLHCFEPTDRTDVQLRQWRSRWPDFLTATSERLPAAYEKSAAARTIYFQSVRFVRVAQLTQRGCPVLALDIDCIVRRDLQTAVEAANGADIGLFLRPMELDPARRVLAACFYAAATTRARAFLERANNMIARHLVLARPCVKLDQMSLYWAYLKRSSELRMWLLPRSLADWDMLPDSVIWTAKGARKYAPRFTMESPSSSD